MNKFAIAFAAGLAATAANADSISESNLAVIDWGVAGTSVVTDGEAQLFPSEITVAGASGAILDVNVTLLGGTHTFMDDLEITLVAPDGTAVVLLQDAGGGDDLAGDLTFDDAAAAAIDDVTGTFTGSGTFQVSVYGDVSSTAPAATGTTLADFNGGDANGTWSLYVYDDAGGDTGAIQGWRLDIETVPTPASAALLGLGGLAAARRRR